VGSLAALADLVELAPADGEATRRSASGPPGEEGAW